MSTFASNSWQVLDIKYKNNQPDFYFPQNKKKCFRKTNTTATTLTFILKGGKAEPHSAHMAAEEVQVLDWSDCSPDLQLVKNVWEMCVEWRHETVTQTWNVAADSLMKNRFKTLNILETYYHSAMK